MFTELPEEYRPENLVVPVVRYLDREEFREITGNFTRNPEGTSFTRYVNAHFMTVYVDTKHVEFVDMHTRQLCLPPEMFLLQLFKHMAKKGPFVARFQFGWRPSGHNWEYAVRDRTDLENCRIFGLEQLIYRPGFSGEYEWRRAYCKRAAFMLNTNTHNQGVNAGTLYGSMYGYRDGRNRKPAMFTSESECLIHIPEVEDAADE